MKSVLYENLPFKTNRQSLIDRRMRPKFDVPKNVNEKMKAIEPIEIDLPKYVYHTTTTPISSFKDDRPFYVSFDKFQSVAHGLSVIQQSMSFLSKDNLYVYVLKPKKKTMRVMLFNEKKRPKNLSNSLGIQYESMSVEGQMLMGMVPNAVKRSEITLKPFAEGSGDNMILAYLMCKSNKINGVRNTIDQDELAVCRPSKSFDIVQKMTIKVKDLDPFRDEIQNVKFMRNNGGYRYTMTSGVNERNFVDFLLNKVAK